MDAPLLMLAGAVAVAAVVGIAAVRIVPAGHCGVVTRAERIARIRSPGPALVLPWVERIEMVPVRPSVIEPVAITAVTRDGVGVRLVVSVLWFVAEPSLGVHAVPDPATVTEAGVERAFHHLVADVDLATLLQDRGCLTARLPVTVSPLLSPFGIEVIDVNLLDVEVRVGPELLRLLE